MTTYAWPTNDSAFALESVVWGVRTLSLESESPLNGTPQTNTRPGSRWAVTLGLRRHTYAERRRLLAFLTRLNGKQHRISFIDPTQAQPTGTIALTGVTTNAPVAQFAESMQLAGCGNGATLLRGDWLKVGAQCVRVVADATANSSGVMTVEFRHMMRAAIASGAQVVTNNVAPIFVLESTAFDVGFDAANYGPELMLPLLEVFS